METFKIEVQELLSRTVNIEAQNIDEAIILANQMYKSEEIVLDYDDLTKSEIIPNSLIDEKDKLITEVIKYLWDDEKKHYEESDRPKDHIFKRLKKLKKLTD